MLKLAALFSDNCVLQRERPIPVWGWSEPGQRITVRLAGNQATAVAGADGSWRATLPALPAGGPHEIAVTGAEALTVKNVLVGEVWVCSGQSNMQMTLTDSANGPQ